MDTSEFNDLRLTLIVAVARNGVIGNEGRIPWEIREDFAHFRKLTLGHACIMGRQTYDGILERIGKPLDMRLNIVISGSGNVKKNDGVVVVNNPDGAMWRANRWTKCYGKEIAFVIGGERIYAQMMPLPHTIALEITEIDEDYEGDRRFPYIDKDIWQEKKRIPGKGFCFVRYERKT